MSKIPLEEYFHSPQVCDWEWIDIFIYSRSVIGGEQANKIVNTSHDATDDSMYSCMIKAALRKLCSVDKDEHT